jgi:hypothetical protein
MVSGLPQTLIIDEFEGVKRTGKIIKIVSKDSALENVTLLLSYQQET